MNSTPAASAKTEEQAFFAVVSEGMMVDGMGNTISMNGQIKIRSPYHPSARELFIAFQLLSTVYGEDTNKEEITGLIISHLNEAIRLIQQQNND